MGVRCHDGDGGCDREQMNSEMWPPWARHYLISLQMGRANNCYDDDDDDDDDDNTVTIQSTDMMQLNTTTYGTHDALVCNILCYQQYQD